MHLHIRSHTLAHIFDHGCHAVKLLTFQENEQQEESEEERRRERERWETHGGAERKEKRCRVGETRRYNVQRIHMRVCFNGLCIKLLPTKG